MSGLAIRPPAGTSRAPLDMNGVPGLRVTTPNAANDRVILYLHGGGYVVGVTGSHVNAVAHLAAAAQATVYFPIYRLAPVHPYPAAVDDAMTSYRWLLDQGVAPESIAIAGDSAGGGLTVALLTAIRDAELPMPRAAALMSPWVDLTGSGESSVTRAHRDPMFR